MISYKYTHLFSPPIQGSGVYANNKSIYYPDGLDVYNNHHDPNSQCNKRFIGPTIKCSDDEWEFFLKYGKVDLVGWREHTTQEKEDFKKCLQLYQSFWELYYEYYEDLCLYAIMYRNINHLNPIIRDVMSVKFFVSKADEIIGFKERLKRDNTCKSEVAFLYYYNRMIFSKIFTKYLNYENMIIAGRNIVYEMRILSSNNIVTNFSNNDIPCGVGINNLTNHDCMEILSHKDELLDEYKEVYKRTLEQYIIEEKGVSYSEEFFTSKFIPYCGRFKMNYRGESGYKKVCKTSIIPILDNDSRNITLSNHERFIVQDWCRQIYQKHDAIRKEKEERQKIQCIKQDYINTLTINNEYRNPYNWQHGNEIKINFLFLQNIFCRSDIYPYNLPRVVVSPKISDKSYLKNLFDLYLKSLLEELCSSKGIESWFLDNSYGRGAAYGRILIWDEYGLDINNAKLIPITIDEIKTLNCNCGGYNKDFFNYLEGLKNIKIYITNNKDCYNKNYISEFIRIRDTFKIITKWECRVHENGSEVEALTEQKLYECLSINQPLKNTLYREVCCCVDFNDIEISYLPGPNLYHKLYSKIDEEEGNFKTLNGDKVYDYRWELFIEGGNILKNRIKNVIEEDYRNIENAQKQKEEEERLARIRYNIRNKHYRDSNISFDEATHLYKVNGVTLQSVTNFVEGCFPKFDAEFFAKKKAVYLEKTTQEVLDMWEQKGKESRELGTELHKKIENYYQDIASSEDDTFKLFLMFANKIELKPYRTEWAVYDEEHNIAGTIDFVDYQNGEYIIYDWKRSDKIIDNGMPIKISKYDEKGNHPLEHLDNTPYYHYALQLSIYKFILENNYNIKISDLRLGIFHPTYNKPYVLRIPYLEKEINDLFNLRSEVLF